MDKIKALLKWIATDGLLHILVCYAMMLTLSPMVGTYAIGITTIVALGKEAYDYFIKKSNNLEQVTHDLICDAIGMGASYVTIFLWWVCNL